MNKYIETCKCHWKEIFALSFAWQELRDQASFDFQFADNTATRKNNAMIAAASAEGDAAKNWSSNYNNVSSVVDKIFGTG